MTEWPELTARIEDGVVVEVFKIVIKGELRIREPERLWVLLIKGKA